MNSYLKWYAFLYLNNLIYIYMLYIYYNLTVFWNYLKKNVTRYFFFFFFLQIIVKHNAYHEMYYVRHSERSIHSYPIKFRKEFTDRIEGEPRQGDPWQ